MRTPITFSLLFLMMLSVNAHHATTANFTQEIITVDGVIEQVRYQNPHSSIVIKHTSDGGEETYWLIETGAKTTLARKGVNLDGLMIGARIQATGRKGRRQYTMFLHEIVFEDGTVFDVEGLTN